MEIGKLNQRIDILGNVTDIDDIGNHKPVWKKLYSVWAEAYMRNSVTASSEVTTAGVTREIRQMVFRVRQSSDTRILTTTAHRVRFQGFEYDIQGIEPDFASKDYLKIICEVRKAGA